MPSTPAHIHPRHTGYSCRAGGGRGAAGGRISSGGHAGMRACGRAGRQGCGHAGRQAGRQAAAAVGVRPGACLGVAVALLIPHKPGEQLAQHQGSPHPAAAESSCADGGGVAGAAMTCIGKTWLDAGCSVFNLLRKYCPRIHHPLPARCPPVCNLQKGPAQVQEDAPPAAASGSEWRQRQSRPPWRPPQLMQLSPLKISGAMDVSKRAAVVQQ